MRRIQVEIDRVVLRGMDPLQRSAFLESLKDSLRKTLSDPVAARAWTHSARTPVLRLTSELRDASPASARRLGSSVARSIGKGVRS
ncbi:MAG TPA: hypothetical protein VGI45_28165 [Terracidiphilus sp.]|jgi:hypothetical protein